MRAAWKEKPLGEVLQLEYGKPLDETDRKPNGRNPVYGANGEKHRTDKFYFDKPSIIIGRKGSAGEINLTEPKFWPLDVTYFVTFDEYQHDLRFLFYLLTTLDLPSLAKGVKPGINRNEVYSKVAKVPPLPEQQRIVAILDEAFDAIATAKANAEKNLQNARALFESQLHAIFTQRDASHVSRKLDEVCEEITVGHVGPMAKHYMDSGIPFLRSQNIRPFRVSLDNLVFIDETFHQSLAKSQLRPGDVAVVRTGYPGTAAVIPDELPVSNCSDLVIVRPSPDADAHYLALFFNSRDGKKLVKGQLVGAAQKHFNVTAAKQVAISFPPVAEQRKIVRKIEEFGLDTQRLESIYQQKLAALEALKKSLLHQAFNGQL
jgi:type I restriction enzyme, S subunit